MPLKYICVSFCYSACHYSLHGNDLLKTMAMKKIYALMIAIFLVNGTMAQWSPKNQDMIDTLPCTSLSFVFFTDVNTGYAVVGVMNCGYLILKTTDAGENWYCSSGVGGTSVFFVNADTGYIDGVYKTIDGGNNWITTNGPSGYSVFFTDSDTGYVVGGMVSGIMPHHSKFIYKTTDGGLNWTTQLNEPYSPALNSVYFTDAYTGYTVGDSGSILKTTDGGSSWNEQSSGTTLGLYSVYFTAKDIGYIVGENGTILKTTNGGTEWLVQASGTTNSLRSVYFSDVNTGYAVGGDDFGWYVILKTTDGGLTWFQQYIEGADYHGTLRSVFFPVADTGYIVGDGCILKTVNGGGFPVGVINQNKNPNNLSVYPNPACTTITIETPSKGSLSIYDLNGQQLLQTTIPQPFISIDVSALLNGVYAVRVVGEKGVVIGKFIKQ